MVRAENADERRRRIEVLNDRRKRFIDSVLTAEEKGLISEPRDYIYIAALERLRKKNPEKANWIYKNYKDPALDEYNRRQSVWIQCEANLYRNKHGDLPSQRELVGEYLRHQNELRYKLFCFFKYPERMVRV